MRITDQGKNHRTGHHIFSSGMAMVLIVAVALSSWNAASPVLAGADTAAASEADAQSDGERATEQTQTADNTTPETTSTEFVFHYDNGSTAVQYVKNGESLTDPGTPSGSQVSTDHGKDVEFLGWYQKNGDAWGEKQTFGPWTSADTTKQTIDLYPRYEKRAYVYYYDESGEQVYAVTKAKPGDTIYTKDPGANASESNPSFMDYLSGASDKAFIGWSTSEDATAPDDNITITSDQTTIKLYPVIQQAKWLTFMSGPEDSDATYFSSEAFLSGSWTRTSLEDKVPQRAGYTFDGWYVRNEATQGSDANLNYEWTITGSDVQVTDAEGGLQESFIDNTVYFNNHSLTRNLTIVAHWSPANTQYTVNYWLQNPDDDGYAYVGSVVKEGKTGEKTDYQPNPDDIAASANAFKDTDGQSILPYLIPHTSTSSTPDQYTFKQAVIKADGSTRLNVYYDRKTYTLRFYYGYQTGSGNNTKYYVFTNTNTYSQADAGKSALTALENQQAAKVGDNKNDAYAQVKSLPNLSARYSSSGTTQAGNSTYFCFDIKARYGQDMSNLWPSQPFSNNSVSSNNRNLEFLSWATRNGSGYYANHSNKNIKGPYSVLDKELISNQDSSDGIAQSFLAYWNNAGQYQYQIYYSLLDGETADITYSGVGYKLHETYDVGSSAKWNEQNALTFKGVSIVPGSDGTNNNKIGAPIGHTGQDKDGKGGIVQFAYQRNLHSINFYTVTNTSTDARVGTDENIPYGEDISKKNVVARHEEEAKAHAPTGYQFAGWYESAATAEELHGNDLTSEDRQRLQATKFKFTGTMPDRDIALYAAYEPIEYFVSLDFNGGESDESEMTYFLIQYGKKIQKIENVSRDSYDFVGWYETDANGNRLSQVAYDFNNNVTHDTYLKAVWKYRGTFKVKYLANDTMDGIDGKESTKPADETYTYTDLSQTIAAHAMEPENSDYVFVGWRVVGDRNDRLYQPGEVIPIESDYARSDTDGTRYINLEPVFQEKGTTGTTYTIKTVDGDKKNTVVPYVVFKLTQTGSNVTTDGYTITTGDNGTVQVPVLNPGTYTLTATKVPDGYNRAPAFTFTVIKDRTITFTNTVDVNYDAASHTFVVSVVPGVRLPQTGGTGTGPFAAAGLLCILTAVLLYGMRSWYNRLR